MRGFRKLTITLVGAPLVALLCGCAKTEDGTTPGSQGFAGSAANSLEAADEQGKSQANSEGARFTDVVAAWESGNKDEAVKQFVSIRWDEPGVFADVPVLSLSEDRFVSLPEDERARMQEESMTLVPTFRNLARHTLSVGSEAQASGDAETATRYCDAVRQFGEALSTPDHLLVIQLVGKAIVSFAQETASKVK